MAKYDGTFVKLADNATFWAVDGGKRRPMGSLEEVHAIGLRPVIVLTEKELDKIKLAAAPKEVKDEE